MRRTVKAIADGHSEDEVPGVLGFPRQDVERDLACALALGLIELA